MELTDIKLNSNSQSDFQFPTEVIDLPSKGLLYPTTHPLHSGSIEMKYMTAKEEDILTSANLIKRGIVLDKFMQSLVVTKFDFDSLLVPDQNAVLIASRILAYGKDYGFEYTCPNCNKSKAITVDLTKFADKEINWDLLVPGNNSFSFTLPISKVEVAFKVLSHGDEKRLVKESEALLKINSEVDHKNSTRLKYSILSINRNADRQYINDFVDNKLLGQDSLALRKYMKSVTPEIDSSFTFVCSDTDCGHVSNYNLPIDINFFWP